MTRLAFLALALLTLAMLVAPRAPGEAATHSSTLWPALTPVLIASGFQSPTHVTSAGDDSGVLYVVERAGRIRTVTNGVVDPAPFLDIRSRVLNENEQGMFAIAFPPGFSTSRDFYVSYVGPRTGGAGDPGRSVVSRFRLLPGSTLADPASEQILLTVDQPDSSHNGGMIAFGPDGYLYIGLGDGGPGGDPENRAQNPQDRLGKLLRIDVESGASPFAVPPTNPVFEDVRSEVWALGLRNPWRFSFDRANGQLWIADVGQESWEEINRVQPAEAGINYMWSCFEGTEPYTRFTPPPSLQCPLGNPVLPVFEYAHGDDVCYSVTGGFVYRGSRFPALQGAYVYGDFCLGTISALRQHPGGGWESRTLANFPRFALTSFGEDDQGEIYLVDFRNGGLYFLSAPPPCGAPASGAATPPPGAFRLHIPAIYRSCPGPY